MSEKHHEFFDSSERKNLPKWAGDARDEYLAVDKIIRSERVDDLYYQYGLDREDEETAEIGQIFLDLLKELKGPIPEYLPLRPQTEEKYDELMADTNCVRMLYYLPKTNEIFIERESVLQKKLKEGQKYVVLDFDLIKERDKASGTCHFVNYAPLTEQSAEFISKNKTLDPYTIEFMLSSLLESASADDRSLVEQALARVKEKIKEQEEVGDQYAAELKKLEQELAEEAKPRFEMMVKIILDGLHSKDKELTVYSGDDFVRVYSLADHCFYEIPITTKRNWLGQKKKTLDRKSQKEIGISEINFREVFDFLERALPGGIGGWIFYREMRID